MLLFIFYFLSKKGNKITAQKFAAKKRKIYPVNYKTNKQLRPPKMFEEVDLSSDDQENSDNSDDNNKENEDENKIQEKTMKRCILEIYHFKSNDSHIIFIFFLFFFCQCYSNLFIFYFIHWNILQHSSSSSSKPSQNPIAVTSVPSLSSSPATTKDSSQSLSRQEQHQQATHSYALLAR